MTWEHLSRLEKCSQLLRILAAMAEADESVPASELQFIQQVGQQHGMTEAEIEAALAQPVEPILIPRDEQARMTVLFYLVFLMKSDGVVSEEETATIHHFGLRLGFRQDMVDRFAALAREHGREDIPMEEMLGVIRGQLN